MGDRRGGHSALGALAALGLLLWTPPLGAQTDLGRLRPAGETIRVVAFGDSGSGQPEQTATADAIARRHAALPFSFGLTAGDNFYRCGVRSVTDERWTTRWEDVYGPLGVLFYATLGNHDYGRPTIACLFRQGSPDVQVAYTQHSRSWRMPARYYTFVAGQARFVALDTEGWSGEQLQWAASVLQKSAGEPDVRWRIVYGHHPIYTSGKHQTEDRVSELRRHLLPVLRARGADLYVAGHDHHLERLHEAGLHFFVAGGGGAGLRNLRETAPQSVFASVANGFLELQISASELAAQFFSADLRPLDPQPLKQGK